MYIRWLGAVACIGALWLGVAAHAQPAAAEAMQVSYPQIPGYDAHYAYRYELVRQLLELTRAEFGDYRLAPYRALTTNDRYAKLLDDGQLVNMAWSSPGTPIAKAQVEVIPVDILKGLLGYRVCLVNGDAPAKLADVQSLSDLANIKIGQAQWVDRAIYHYNHVQEVDAPTIDSLFMMLSAKRFDCIALGADEVVDIYNNRKPQYPFLAIDPHLLIHYQYPIYFYISKKTPKLAQRLRLGLQTMQASGELDKLFMQYHSQYLAQLELKKRKVICLKSPYITSENQCTTAIEYPYSP